MLPHHDVALSGLIDRVIQYGAATCSWDELYAWYKVSELDNQVWADVYKRFHAMWAYYGYEGAPELKVHHSENSFTLLRDPSEDESVTTIAANGELQEDDDSEDAEG